MFSKFQLIRTSAPINIDNIEYTKDDYIEIHNKLNETKTLLDSIPSEIYRKISSYKDMYNTLRQKLRNRFNVQIVTNATLKMYEILEKFNFISQSTGSFTVFCNAELPGGFIIAINHYIKTKYPNIDFHWLANSYISSNALDDIYGIYKNNRSNWLMDRDMNGDITNISNLLKIKSKVKALYPLGINLYTSDIGINVSSDYNSQEQQLLLLNYCQVLCGLMVLKIEGHMVTKQFTYFTSFNTSLLILLSNIFKKVYITKPATSRPFNSEIYIVCKYYKGMSDKMSNYLLSRISTVNSKIPLVLYQNPVYLRSIADIIYNRQIDEIQNMVDIYKNHSDFDKLVQINKNIEQEKWIKNNKIIFMPSEYYIPYNGK